MRRKRLSLIIALLLLALLVGGLGWQVYATVRQERLNHALIAAIEQNNPRLALELLKQGADPNAKAVTDKSQPLWQLLWNALWHRKQAQSGPCALMLSVENNDGSLTQALLRQGAYDVNARFTNWEFFPGTTLLMAEIDNGDADTAQALLEHGAQVNAQNDWGESALMRARDDRCAELLLRWGADVNARDHHRDTVLMHAVHYNGLWIARLLERGVDVNAANDSGVTVLMSAAWAGQVKNVRLLLAHGANPNAKDDMGKTVLYVERHGDVIVNAQNIIPILKQAGAKE